MTGGPAYARLSRRNFLSVTAVAAGGAVLAGCHSGGATSKQDSLKFSSYLFSDFKAALQKVLALWEQDHPGITLQTEYAGGNDYWTKVQTEVAAGTPPNVGIGENASLVSYAKDGVLLSLDEAIATAKFDLGKYVDSAVAQYRWADGDLDSGGKGGKMYGLPSDAQGFIFAYNKKMFDDAGVDYPTDDWTWDDVVDAAKQIADPAQNKWGVGAPAMGTLFRGNFVYSAGGSLSTPDFKKSALDSPETVEAYKWVWDLIHTHKVAPHPTPSQNEQVDLFASGRVAMAFDGIWMVSTWGQVKNFDWDIALLPKHPSTGKRTTSVESDGWWVYRGSKDEQLAWSLASFLAGEKAQRKFAELDYIVPPSISRISQAWYSKKPPVSRQKALLNVLHDSRKRDGTFVGFPKVEEAITPLLEKAFLGGQSITKQLGEAAEAMTAELQKAQAGQ